jgi:hypothetical protein
MPRRSKRDHELLVSATKDAIIGYVRDGVPVSSVGELVGYDRTTITEWMSKDAGFRHNIFKARQEVSSKCIRNILEKDDWRAQAWYLERQFPAEFAAPHAIEKILKEYGLIPDSDAGTTDSSEFARSIASNSSGGNPKKQKGS